MIWHVRVVTVMVIWHVRVVTVVVMWHARVVSVVVTQLVSVSSEGGYGDMACYGCYGDGDWLHLSRVRRLT